MLFAPLLVVGQIAAIAGQPAGDRDQPTTTKLVLRPAPQPHMALKYQLLPGMLNRKPGNAAVTYNKIALWMAQRSEEAKKDGERVAKWLEGPLAEMPKDEVRQTLARLKPALDDLDLAARRQDCDWQLPLGERNFMMILLPELQELRNFGRLLALQARLQIAEGKFDEALRTIQTGYAVGRHAAQGPTLINGLVGIAICRMMSQRIEELIAQPGAPNLYWALTALPQPLIDLRPAVDAEMNILYLSFPALRQVDTTLRTPAHWQHFLDELADSLAMVMGGGENSPQVGWRFILTALAIKGYPQARQALIDQGRTPAEVEAMPVAQVVTLYTLETYNEIRDGVFKWFYVPYWEAYGDRRQRDEELIRASRHKEVFPLASMLLPAVSSVHFATARNERDIALLRTIEALRLYGAAHEGKLPEKLGDVAEAPVPVDPTTGKPFLYKKTGDVAVLESPAPPGRTQKDYGLRYEIRLAK
jgi:hypothetical protein